MFRTKKKTTARKTRRFEQLQDRKLMAADAGFAVTDAADLGDQKDLSAFISVEKATAVTKQVATISQDVHVAPADLKSAPTKAIDALFENLPTEELGFVEGDNTLGIKDLIDPAEGVTGFVPDGTGGAEDFESVDPRDPAELGGEKGADDGLAPADHSTLTTPSLGLGGIASTDPEDAGRATGEASRRAADAANPPASEATDSDGASEGGSFADGVRETVAPRPSILWDWNGQTHRPPRNRGILHEWGGGLRETHDPDAEPTGVVLPHQDTPELNTNDGLQDPNRVNPEQPDNGGPGPRQINPGSSIVINPAGEAQQNREVSQEQADHWREELQRRAGGIVNPAR